MNEEEDGEEELSETEEAWESEKGGAGGDENAAKNRRKNTDLPSTSSAQKRYVTILSKLLYPCLAVIANANSQIECKTLFVLPSKSQA